MGRKDLCCVTTGRIKARNFAECLSFSFNNKAKYHNWHWLKNDPQSVENEVVFCFIFSFVFSPSYSSVLAVHLITSVYYYISLLSERENVCVRERLGSNCIIMIDAVLLMEFIVCIWLLRVLCHLIKQKHGMHKYSHKNRLYNNTLTTTHT